MNRLAVLLLFLLIVPARAQPGGGAAFDAGLVANVYAVALNFMEPRILQPVPVPTLTVWGLRGLTALDPDLLAIQRDHTLLLTEGERVLAEEAEPSGSAPADWAAAAVRLSQAAVAVSPAVRRAGTQGIIQSFFDELFNHLDPYSRYVAPLAAVTDRAGRNGTAGVGVRVNEQHGEIVVDSVVAGGPAARAGLVPGDIVLRVDGVRMRGKDAGTVADILAGPVGTSLRVTWRSRDGHVHAATMQRAMVPPETVFSERAGDLLLIRITSFDESTAAHLAAVLQDAMAAGPTPSGIILDLRGNRGGLLRQAVDAADTLLPAGVVAYTAGRDPDADHVWESQRGELAEGVPVVLAIDGRTASAAEILAAALTDRGRAVAVGSVTLGKGLVQTIVPLPDGGELFVTWSRVLAPRGWPIQGLGVLPQVCTSLGESALQHQLTALAEGQQPMQASIDAERSARAPLSPERILAIRSACPAAVGRDVDLTTARALIENPAAYAAALLPPMQAAAVR